MRIGRCVGREDVAPVHAVVGDEYVWRDHVAFANNDGPKRRALSASEAFATASLATHQKSRKGPSIYDVRKILGFFDPLLPLSAFGTDLQY